MNETHLNVLSAVHLLGDGLNLLLDGEVVLVQELEGVILLARLDDGLSELDGSESSLGPKGSRDSGVGAGGESGLLDEGGLGVGVVAVGVRREGRSAREGGKRREEEERT